MIHPAAAVVFLLLMFVGCQEQAREHPSARDRATVAADTTGCHLLAIVAHSDPEALLREFVERDSRGEFVQSKVWFDGAVDCPGREPRVDWATMARNPRIHVLSRDADSLLAEVRWERLAVGDAWMHDTEYDTLMVVHTPYGWRIRSPALIPHIPVPPPPPLEAGQPKEPAP